MVINFTGIESYCQPTNSIKGDKYMTMVDEMQTKAS